MTAKTSSKTSKEAKQSIIYPHKTLSRKDEIKYRTSDPKKMLNKWIASRVLRTWNDDFIDEDTKEIVSIGRNEILFEKGKLLDQDTIQKVMFDIQAGDIKDIEVTNQNRMGEETQYNRIIPFVVQVLTNEKRYKYLVFASSVSNACEIAKDYFEMNLAHQFYITMVNKLNSCVVLNDSRLFDDVLEIKPIGDEPEYDDDGNEIKPEEKKVKFYQVDLNVKSQLDIASDDNGLDTTYVCQTYSAEDAISLIRNDLKKNELERIERVLESAKANNYKPDEEDIKERHFVISIIKLVPMPIYDMIPRDLSMQYNDDL